MRTIAVDALALFTGGVLAIAVRGPGSVTSREVHAGRLVESHLEGADYVDNYTIELPAGTRITIEDIEEAAIQKGRLLARTDSEVVFTDQAPGLTFQVAYALSESVDILILEFTTAVHYTTWVGRVYFLFVRPVHRLGLPWLTAWTARRALRIRR